MPDFSFEETETVLDKESPQVHGSSPNLGITSSTEEQKTITLMVKFIKSIHFKNHRFVMQRQNNLKEYCYNPSIKCPSTFTEQYFTNVEVTESSFS